MKTWTRTFLCCLLLPSLPSHAEIQKFGDAHGHLCARGGLESPFDNRELGFQLTASETPIVPILIGDDMKTFAAWHALSDEGIYVNPVVPPAVAPGSSLLRTSYMATHTDDQLDKVLAKLGFKGWRNGT